jgi:hypothetical protein
MNETMKEDGKTERGCIHVERKKRRKKKERKLHRPDSFVRSLDSLCTTESSSLVEPVRSLPPPQESTTGPSHT